jgi:holo-[acyl-carrier protein] synthase
MPEMKVEDDNKFQRLHTSEPALQVTGHGLEIVETRRIERLIKRMGDNFEMQRFTVTERSVPDGAKRIQYLTGRFAAKAAICQALGTAWCQGISWLDIEVRRSPTGQPVVVLYGDCQNIATALGIRKWLLSISHVSSCAAASAIALGVTHNL